MKKCLLYIGVCALTLGLNTTLIYAESNSDNLSNDNATSSNNVTDRIKVRVRENNGVRNELIKTRTEERGDMRIERTEDRLMVQRTLSPTSSTSTQREALRVKMEERREDRIERIENRKESIQERREEIKERGDQIRREIFNKQKEHIVSQLNRALDNLRQIRERISARIDKAEDSGRDMAKAKVALSIADNKIITAQTSINTLIAYVPEMATSTATSTPNTEEVRVDKIRKVANDAIKAVKDAREALIKTNIEIAKSMGLKVRQDGRIIATSTATSTTNTATSTNSGTSTSTATTTSTTTTQ